MKVLHPIGFAFCRLFSLLSILFIAVILVNISTLSRGYAQDSDVRPAELRNLTFFPTSIDVTDGPQSVTVTAEVTDDLSGVSPGGVIVSFQTPSGIRWLALWLHLISGDEMDGTYEDIITFEPFIEAGIWTIDSVFIYDQAGNTILLDTAALNAAGLPTELTVTSVPDTEAPTLVGVTLSQTNIDVSTGSKDVSVNLELTDSLSGVIFNPSTKVRSPGFILTFNSPSGQQKKRISDIEFNLISGNPNNGIWTANATFPQFSEPGVWEIVWISIGDAAGNIASFSNVELEALGLDRKMNVTSIPADTSPPILTNIEVVPSFIDTASSSQNVVVTLSIEDDLSGVSFLSDTPIGGLSYGATFKSQSGSQENRISSHDHDIEHVSGTMLDGKWRGTMVIPQFAEAGTWRVDLINLKDSAQNVTRLDASDLESLGLQTELIVTRPSLVVDGVIDPIVGGTVEDQTFGDRAQVTIPPNVLTQSTEMAIDVFEESLNIPNPVGFTSEGTRFVNINLDPEPEFPLPAPGLTVVLPVENPLQPWTPISLFRVDPATGNLVPAFDVLGQPVVGSVDGSGLSATFVGISSLSTIVGLLPEATSTLLSTSFEDLSLSNPDTITPLLFTGEGYGASSRFGIAKHPEFTNWKVDSNSRTGNLAINVIPNGNPDTNLANSATTSVSSALLDSVFDVSEYDSVSLKLWVTTTSNPRIASIHNCDSGLNVYYRVDNGSWIHKTNICGQHKTESIGWMFSTLDFDTSIYSTIEFAFEYELQNNPVADPTVFFMIDDIEITGIIKKTGIVKVPNVLGLTQSNAEKAITDAGLVVGEITNKTLCSIQTGEVISQNPAAGGDPVMAGSEVDLVIVSEPEIVNDKFPPLGSDDANIAYDSAPCIPEGASGTFTIGSWFVNTSHDTLCSLYFKVVTMNEEDVLCNGDEGAVGIGSTLTLPLEGDLEDGLLAPGESFYVEFKVGLASMDRFDFSVDLFGVVAE